MARQNNMVPKGAASHLRPPHASHDPSAPAQGYTSAYPSPYDPAEGAGQAPPAGSGTRDIFSTLRPDARFEPFAPPAGRPQTQGNFGRQPFGEPDGQSYQAQAHTHDPYGRPLPGGYPAQGGYGSDAAPEHDPRYYGQQPQHGYAPQSHYGHDDAYAYDDPYRPDAADPYGAQLASGHGTDAGYYDEDYPEEAEAPARRGPRALVVVGALLGAIALGGGLAYGYKAMTSGGREGGKLPILRADSAPTKAQPTDPGGKQVAHTDKKFLNNRLVEDRGPARPVPVSILPPAPERETGDGPRRVPTMVVNRDGTIAPSGSAPSAPSGPPASGVPGLLIDGFAARTPPPPQREAAPPPPPPPARAMPVEEVAPAAPPRRVASAPPTSAIEPPASAAPAPAPRVQDEPRRPVPTRQAARTPAPAPAASAPAPSSGFVAVLSSRQTHMDALKSLADIQQKHPGILKGRAADVREANLGEKGVWYRVVVGPPGSRETANSVCGQLKTQGYSGCWIMAY
jgi:hypothetical protein